MKERDKRRANAGHLSLEIKQADHDGLSQVAHLFDQYRQFYGQESDLAGAQGFISERIELDDSVILVAQVGGDLVGFAQLYPTFSSVAMRRVWILNDLFVLPDSRRQAIGRRLLDAAVQHAQSTGATRVVLATEVGNTVAKSLYEHDGWVRDTTFDHYSKGLAAN